MPGVQELIVILLIVVVLFGASRLPQLGKGLGEGIRNFRSGLKGDENQDTLKEANPSQSQKSNDS